MRIATKLIIEQPIPCGAISKNLVVGTEHDVVEPPVEYSEKYPNGDGSYWVMGVGEPIRIKYHECTITEYKNI